VEFRVVGGVTGQEVCAASVSISLALLDRQDVAPERFWSAQPLVAQGEAVLVYVPCAANDSSAWETLLANGLRSRSVKASTCNEGFAPIMTICLLPSNSIVIVGVVAVVAFAVAAVAAVPDIYGSPICAVSSSAQHLLSYSHPLSPLPVRAQCRRDRTCQTQTYGLANSLCPSRPLCLSLCVLRKQWTV